MYYAEKKLSRIGKSSLGVIIPREWLFAMGLHKSGDAIRASYDPRLRRVYIDLHPNGADALNFNNISEEYPNDANDFTPQPRTKYLPSPHPAHTAAQWAKCDNTYKEQQLALLKEAEERGFDITTKADFEQYEQIRRDETYQKFYAPKQEVRQYTNFNDIPQPIKDIYFSKVEPFIDNSNSGYPKSEWFRLFLESLNKDTDAKRAEYLSNSIYYLKEKYKRLEDEL